MDLLSLTDAVAIQILGTITAVATILGTIAVGYLDLRKRMLEIQKRTDKTGNDMAQLEKNTNSKMDLLIAATKVASESIGADKERERSKREAISAIAPTSKQQ